MFMAIKFEDGRDTLIIRVKDEAGVIREKKKWEKDYVVRQVATSNAGTGFIFIASPKPHYIWE